MDPLLLWTLTISLMFTGGQCGSQSMSCSTVNGKTVCESQKSDGNIAGASSSAMFGQGGPYQDANAMTGNTYNGQSSSSRTQAGNMPPGGFAPAPGGFGFPFGAPGFGGGFGNPNDISANNIGNTGTGSSSFTSTSNSDGTGVGGAFAGGFAGTGGGFVGTGGFVGAGGPIPGIPAFGPGVGVAVAMPFDPFRAVFGGGGFPGFGGGFPFGRR